MTAPFPDDVDPASGFRLPLPKRQALDQIGQKVYDFANKPGATLAGLHGPLGICLYSPPCAELFSALNTYLRYESGLSAPVREVAILAVAREMDSNFEWAAHEHVALEAGASADLIERIRSRSSLADIDEPYATIIALVRQVFATHKVEPELFAQARTYFSDRHLVELVLLIGSYTSTAILLSVFDMQLRPGTAKKLSTP